MPTGDAKLNAFESLFRSAVKDVFRLDPPPMQRVMILLDDAAEAAVWRDSVAGFLSCIDSAEHLEWQIETRGAQQASPVLHVIGVVQAAALALIVARRHLLGTQKNLPHTLGSVVDVLTQATTTPILLMPPPGFQLPASTDRVMVVTDHLSGDDRLVNFGVEFTHKRGTLFLAHLEDSAMLEYFLAAVDKMASIDSDLARQELPDRLLKAPREYIQTVADVLAAAEIEETVQAIVEHGHGVGSYQELMAKHDVDLLIFNTKDDRQDAMHAMAYALAVQIRSRPLLLL